MPSARTILAAFADALTSFCTVDPVAWLLRRYCDRGSHFPVAVPGGDFGRAAAGAHAVQCLLCDKVFIVTDTPERVR